MSEAKTLNFLNKIIKVAWWKRNSQGVQLLICYSKRSFFSLSPFLLFSNFLMWIKFFFPLSSYFTSQLFLISKANLTIGVNSSRKNGLLCLVFIFCFSLLGLKCKREITWFVKLNNYLLILCFWANHYGHPINKWSTDLNPGL